MLLLLGLLPLSAPVRPQKHLAIMHVNAIRLCTSTGKNLAKVEFGRAALIIATVQVEAAR